MGNNVLVLLAAYNGMQWLNEQLHSILSQENVNVSITVSVDSSSDGTEKFIRELAEKDSRISYLPMGMSFGGAARNFYRLILEADIKDADYISFADQDDIWNINKLINAVKFLDDYDFYSSNVLAFWHDGRECKINKSQPFVKFDYFFEAAGPGCTYVIKREAYLRLRKFIQDNKEVVTNFCLHDWLIYAFARTNGFKWYIDNNTNMLYRQHANNQVGANNNVKALIKRLKLIKSNWYRGEIYKLACIFNNSDAALVKGALTNGYIGNLILLKNIYHIRRRLRDRIFFSIALIMNVF